MIIVINKHNQVFKMFVNNMDELWYRQNKEFKKRKNKEKMQVHFVAFFLCIVHYYYLSPAKEGGAMRLKEGGE